MAGGDISRIKLEPRERSRRTLEERLYLRFPKLSAATSRLIFRLPPSSRLRQASLRRSIELAAAAYNRRDLDAVVITYGPDFEYLPGQKWVDAGLVEPRYVGKDGYTAYVRATEEVWGEENLFRPFVLFDLGDRLVVLAHERMRAQASGVPLTEEFAYVVEAENGRVARLREYYDHAEALAAVGISASKQLVTG